MLRSTSSLLVVALFAGSSSANAEGLRCTGSNDQTNEPYVAVYSMMPPKLALYRVVNGAEQLITADFTCASAREEVPSIDCEPNGTYPIAFPPYPDFSLYSVTSDAGATGMTLTGLSGFSGPQVFARLGCGSIL